MPGTQPFSVTWANVISVWESARGCPSTSLTTINSFGLTLRRFLLSHVLWYVTAES